MCANNLSRVDSCRLLLVIAIRIRNNIANPLSSFFSCLLSYIYRLKFPLKTFFSFFLFDCAPPLSLSKNNRETPATQRSGNFRNRELEKYPGIKHKTSIVLIYFSKSSVFSPYYLTIYIFMTISFC